MMKIPKTQTAVVIWAAGGPEVLIANEIPVETPDPGEILICVTAAGINRHDVHQRASGKHSDGRAVPGLEVCGTVAAIGSEVTGVVQGERVMALVPGGGYGQYVIAPASLVMPVPETLSDIEAAAIPEAAFTPWWNFFHLMSLQKGQFALFHGGTSGVGHIALQAMSALGYDVIATAGSADKVAACKEFGAMAAFSYNDPNLAAQVMDATNGAGISTLLDVSAGAHLAQDLAIMAPDGTMAHLSGGGGGTLDLPLRDLMAKRIRVTGSLLRPLPLDRKTQVADAIRREVWPLLGKSVRPSIAKIFQWTDASFAHAMMETGGHIGKIILNVTHD
jgi:putative PIG3 family NAD(P)H quinone oxidoreductase